MGGYHTFIDSVCVTARGKLIVTLDIKMPKTFAFLHRPLPFIKFHYYQACLFFSYKIIKSPEKGLYTRDISIRFCLCVRLRVTSAGLTKIYE